jgi:hypothetical protein
MTIKIKYMVGPKARLLVYVMVGFSISLTAYSVIHEEVHYFTLKLLGHSGSINWNMLMPTMQMYTLETISYTHRAIIAVSPYVFDLSILMILYLLNVYHNNKQTLLSMIAAIPFTDTVFNFMGYAPALVFAKPNDFSNILRIGNLMGYSPLFVLPLIWIVPLVACYFFRPFWNVLYPKIATLYSEVRTERNNRNRERSV